MPTINQIPQNETVDPTGTGMDLFVNWLNHHGHADIAPAIGCAPAVWTDNRTTAEWNFTCGQFNGCIDITFNYADACGNEMTWTATFCMEDVSPPICGFPVDLTVDCSDAMSELIIDAWLASEEPTDISHPIVVSNDYDLEISGNCGNATLITWTYTDACGNTSTRAASITILDETPPKLITPAASVIVECGNNATSAYANWIANNGGAIAHDFCSEITWSVSSPGMPSSCDDFVYALFTATDACGNSISTAASFSIMDTTAPVFEGIPASQNFECMDSLPPPTNISATDACNGFVDIIFEETTVNDTLIRLWVATDDCGNSTSESQILTFSSDITPPNLHGVPVDLTIDCNDVLPALPVVTATDNCDNSIVVLFLENMTPNSIIQTWTATDNAGNQSNSSRLITVLQDVMPPTLSGIPTDITLDCNDNLPSMPEVTALDNCDDTVVVLFSENMTSEAILQTWTATDNSGNESSATRTISILEDVEAPMLIGIPSDAILGCNETPNPPPNIIATDNCDADIVVIFSEVQTPYYCGETILRTWEATDNTGNQTTAYQTISIIIDEQPPLLTGVPPDISLDCVQPIPLPAMVGVDDNCDETTLEFEETISGDDCLLSYVIQRTWTATDACANMAQSTQKITVLDLFSEISIINPPSDLNLDCTDDMPSPATINASTTCDDGIIYTDFMDETIAGDCPNNYTILRTWSVSDNCGTAEIFTQTINFEDTLAPVFTYIPPSEFVSCTYFPDGFGEPAIEDNCSAFTVEIIDGENAYNCDEQFDITRTWIATDACGNSSSTTQTLTIWPDVLSPIFLFIPGDDVIQCPDEAEFGEAVIVDSCLEFEVTIEDEVIQEGACPEGYTVRRTWTALNSCGYSETHSQTIVVLPEPMLAFTNLPENKVINCSDTIEFDEPNCESNCLTGFDLTYEDNLLENCAGAVYTRVWTAIDSCGNTATASQTIEVIDDIAPVFTTILPDKTIGCTDVILFQTPEVTDLCGEVTLTFTDTQAPTTCSGIAAATTRVWTAIDACENVASISQTISMTEDSEAPIFDLISETLELSFMDYQAWEIPTPIVTDNCSSPTLEGPFITWKTNAVTYTWTATDACGNASSIFKKINFDEPIFGTAPGLNDEWFTLSPNPVNHLLTIHFISMKTSETAVNIIDLYGREWLFQSTITSEGLNKITLPTSSLPVGSYFLILKNKEQQQIQRFLKID